MSRSRSQTLRNSTPRFRARSPGREKPRATTPVTVSHPALPAQDVAALVAEIVVGMDGGFTLLRMDETGVLADRLPSALSAYSFYVLWARYLNPTIVPVPMW